MIRKVIQHKEHDARLLPSSRMLHFGNIYRTGLTYPQPISTSRRDRMKFQRLPILSGSKLVDVLLRILQDKQTCNMTSSNSNGQLTIYRTRSNCLFIGDIGRHRPTWSDVRNSRWRQQNRKWNNFWTESDSEAIQRLSHISTFHVDSNMTVLTLFDIVNLKWRWHTHRMWFAVV